MFYRLINLLYQIHVYLLICLLSTGLYMSKYASYIYMFTCLNTYNMYSISYMHQFSICLHFYVSLCLSILHVSMSIYSTCLPYQLSAKSAQPIPDSCLVFVACLHLTQAKIWFGLV